MRAFFLTAALLLPVLFPGLYAGPPRKGISYKPTPEGGRACYVDGVFAYEMPVVPKGLWGATFGVQATPVLKDGPVDRKDWADFLRSKGVLFGKGASATFYAQFGHLVVVNTREQQDALMKLTGARTEEP